MKQYILDKDNNPVETDLMGWANWIEGDKKKRIIKQETVGKMFVSTVFLGLDMSWNEKGPPIIFETMIFKLKKDGGRESELDAGGEYQERCSTHKEALEMHETAVKYAKYYQTWEAKLARMMRKVITTLSNTFKTIRGK